MKDTSWNDDRMAQDHREHLKNHICTTRCVSLLAIIIGAIVGISFSFLLNLLSLAIGLSAFPTGPSGQIAFAVGGFIGLVVFAFVAMFPAGWIAGFLGRSHCLRRKMGELYGLGTWGLSLIVTIILAAYAGQFLEQSNYLINRNVMLVRFSETGAKTAYEPALNKKVEVPAVKTSTPATTATSLGMVTFVTFFILFIGLIASCLGGRLGMTHHRRFITRTSADYCPRCK